MISLTMYYVPSSVELLGLTINLQILNQDSQPPVFKQDWRRWLDGRHINLCKMTEKLNEELIRERRGKKGRKARGRQVRRTMKRMKRWRRGSSHDNEGSRTRLWGNQKERRKRKKKRRLEEDWRKTKAFVGGGGGGEERGGGGGGAGGDTNEAQTNREYESSQWPRRGVEGRTTMTERRTHTPTHSVTVDGRITHLLWDWRLCDVKIVYKCWRDWHM